MSAKKVSRPVGRPACVACQKELPPSFEKAKERDPDCADVRDELAWRWQQRPLRVRSYGLMGYFCGPNCATIYGLAAAAGRLGIRSGESRPIPSKLAEAEISWRISLRAAAIASARRRRDGERRKAEAIAAGLEIDGERS